VSAVWQVVIENLELVFVCVTEEDTCDGRRTKAPDDTVEKGGRVRESIAAILVSTLASVPFQDGMF